MKKRACDSCYRRKIHCDGAVPKCDWCSHHNLPCTFNRPAPPRKRKGALTREGKAASPKRFGATPVRDRDLLHGLGTGSSDVVHRARSRPSPSPAYTTSSASPASCSSSPLLQPPIPETTDATLPHGSAIGKLHFAGHYLGQISSQSGIPFFSAHGQRWIQSRTGVSKSAAFEALYVSGPPWQTRHDIHPSLLDCSSLPQFDTITHLPGRDVLQHCLVAYRASHFRLTFPIIDTVLFEHTIDLAYDLRPGPLSLERLNAKACVLAFVACMSVYEPYRSAVLSSIDGEACAVKAQYLMPQLLHGCSLTGLQTTIMLNMYFMFEGQLQKASVLHSVSCRIMCMLGAHTMIVPTPPCQQSVDRPWRVKSQLRKLFWLCYWYDKDISLRTEQPPCLNDDDCDLTLPRGYLETKYGKDRTITDLLQMEETITPILLGDLRLSILKSKTIRLLYTTAALRKSDAELIRDIRQLDDELEEWRMSIPLDRRPTLSLSHVAKVELDMPAPLRMEMIMLHFEYHYLVTTIHQATGRCRSWSMNGSREMEGVSSSMALAVAASRSTLFYLRAAVHALLGEAFWMAVFYPMSAVMTIFCKILYDPLDPRADTDLDLLNSAPHLIKEMRMRRTAPKEIAHMKVMDDFIAELARLANCAIAKARRERDGRSGSELPS